LIDEGFGIADFAGAGLLACYDELMKLAVEPE
jgi:hypothetical protein